MKPVSAEALGLLTCVRHVTGARIRAKEAIALQLSRLLEERVAAAEGVRNVHHWLSIIGATHPILHTHFLIHIHLLPKFCYMVRSQGRCDVLDAARGEEADWIDLNTVQGYRRMVFCESILDELKLNLRTSDNDSDATARRALEAICRNRLVPTTWLNKVRRRCKMC